MKQKLKYLLIIGTTLSVVNGVTEFENLGWDGAKKTMSHTVRTGLNTIETNTENRSQNYQLCVKVGQRIQNLSQDIKGLRKRAAEYATMLDSKYGSLLDIHLNLSKNKNDIVAKLNHLHAEKMYFVQQIKLLHTNSLTIDAQQELEIRLYRKATTVVDTTSGRWKESARTTESLKKEAQQNCLGKIDRIEYTAAAGSLQTAIMTPSTTRPPKPVQERSPLMSGNISPLALSDDDADDTNSYTPDSFGMLPPPMIAVPSQATSRDNTPYPSPVASPNTPRPSRTGSGDSFGLPSPAAGSPVTPLQWRGLDKIRV